MKSLGLDYFKTLKFEGKETIVKDVNYEGDGVYTVNVEDITDKPLDDFISEYQHLYIENKTLKEEIKEYKKLLKQINKTMEMYLPRK